MINSTTSPSTSSEGLFSSVESKHILESIFGCEKPSNFVTVYDAFTGTGKTRDTLRFLAKNHKKVRVVIAFPEIINVLEAVVQFKAMVEEECGKTARTNIPRYTDYVFEVKQSDIDTLEERSAKAKGDDLDLLRKCLQLAATANARTKLRGRKEDLKTVGIIFTTHASLLNMATYDFLEERHVIIDEAPVCYRVDSMEVSNLDRARENLKPDNNSFYLETETGTKSTLERIAAGVMAVKELTYNNPSNASEGNPDGVSHCFRVFANLNDWNCASVSIMTAFAKGTVAQELNLLCGNSFGFIESAKNKQAKSNCVKRIEFKLLPVRAKISEGSKETKETKKARESLRDVLVTQNAYVTTHKSHHKFFENSGVKALKLNATGLNTFRDFDAIGVDSLLFNSPLQKAKNVAAYGEDAAKELEDNAIGASLMQSVMRSCLRTDGEKKLKVYAYDDRVVLFINKMIQSYWKPEIKLSAKAEPVETTQQNFEEDTQPTCEQDLDCEEVEKDQFNQEYGRTLYEDFEEDEDAAD